MVLPGDDAEASRALLIERRSQRGSIIIVSIILVLTVGLFVLLMLMPKLVASGLLAYSFGLRHAVDVDHIAAIDNITRKLTTRDSSPRTVGMFFALGHSSVVFLACCAILLTQRFMSDFLDTFSKYGSIVGTAISGGFLFALGLLNLYTATQLWMAWRGGTRSAHSHDVIGCCLRCCPRLFDSISKPWHMLVVGFLFGLGFDTSTEVGLLAIVAVSHGLVTPFVILLLPLLFMSGMCLLDTLNGFFMAWIYRTSLEDDDQKIYFNLFVTVTSGLVALLVGLLELLGLLGSQARLHGWFWEAVQSANDHFELLGLAVVSLFFLAMMTAVCCFRRVFRDRQARRPSPAYVREHVIRYVQNGQFIDRSGV
ncbi:hoxN [Symbiodinium natans]|uniref:Nickel/cobalt efflux system n=1 Tax=Symbiodinium natans TaxID=878477 RepID=A0A812MG85_9DINO|nr:hoxN [Symbiodinium natans]